MTILPNKLQCRLVSKTTKPVTHTDEVAVNRQSIKGVHTPLFDAIGRVNKKAPNNIILPNPKTIIWAGLNQYRIVGLFLNFFNICFLLSYNSY